MKNKEGIFSKNNYNTQLEALLDSKEYPDEAKSLILNAAYKIENAYKDYQRITQSVKTKSDIVEDITNSLEANCSSIEILNPKKKQLKMYVDKRKKHIKTFPNEVDLLQAIYYIKTPYAKNIEDIFEKTVTIALQKGMALSGAEIIRDFNGWSWNNILEDDESKFYNLIYKDFVMLIGELEIEKILQNKDVLTALKNKLEDIYGDKKAQKIMDSLIKSCTYIYMKRNSKNEEEVKSYLNEKKKFMNKISDKANYVLEITKQNNEFMKQVGIVDSIINNTAILKKKYSSKSIQEKYKSIETYKMYLIKYKNKVEDTIEGNRKLINPFEYVKTKEKVQNEVETLSDIIASSSKRNNLYSSLVNLQKNIIECINKKIDVYDLKKELIQLAYEFRYFVYTPVKNKYICSIKDLDIELRNVQEKFVKKLCNARVLERFSNKDNLNFRILKYIFETKIVDIDKLLIKMEYKDKKLYLNYYDGNNLENQEIIDFDSWNQTDLLKRTDRKIRIFV